MAGEGSACVETQAIVPHLEHRAVRIGRKPEINGFGMRMFYGIPYRFLTDAIDGFLDFQGQFFNRTKIKAHIDIVVEAHDIRQF